MSQWLEAPDRDFGIGDDAISFHESEDAAACRLRETNGVRVELAERVGRRLSERTPLDGL